LLDLSKVIWGPSRHFGSLTAANWVSFSFNVSYSSCWSYSLINTLKLKNIWWWRINTWTRYLSDKKVWCLWSGCMSVPLYVYVTHNQHVILYWWHKKVLWQYQHCQWRHRTSWRLVGGFFDPLFKRSRLYCTDVCLPWYFWHIKVWWQYLHR